MWNYHCSLCGEECNEKKDYWCGDCSFVVALAMSSVILIYSECSSLFILQLYLYKPDFGFCLNVFC